MFLKIVQQTLWSSSQKTNWNLYKWKKLPFISGDGSSRHQMGFVFSNLSHQNYTSGKLFPNVPLRSNCKNLNRLEYVAITNNLNFLMTYTEKIYFLLVLHVRSKSAGVSPHLGNSENQNHRTVIISHITEQKRDLVSPAFCHSRKCHLCSYIFSRVQTQI